MTESVCGTWELSIFTFIKWTATLSYSAAVRIRNIIVTKFKFWRKRTRSKFEVVLLFHIGFLSGVKATMQWLPEADKWRKQDSRSCPWAPELLEMEGAASSVVHPRVSSALRVVHKMKNSYTHPWPLSIRSFSLVRKLSSQTAGPWKLKERKTRE